LVILGFEFVALWLIAIYSPNWGAPPPFFVSGIFQIGSWASLCNPPIYASCIAELIGAWYHTHRFLVDVGSCKLSAWAGL
jgi:hypothetical protein